MTLEEVSKIPPRPRHHCESVPVALEKAEVLRDHSIHHKGVEAMVEVQGAIGIMEI